MAKRRAKRTSRRKGRGMSKGTKTLLVVGAAAGAGYLLYKAMQKPEGEPTPEGPGGTITLQIIPAGGGVGYRGIGAIGTSLVEGSSGNQAIATITNTSVYTGTTQKAPYSFGVFVKVFKGTALPTDLGTANVWVGGMLGGLYAQGPAVAVGAGATLVAPTILLTMLFGYSGPAVAIAEVYTTDMVTKLGQSATTAITITAAGVTPGGTITW